MDFAFKQYLDYNQDYAGTPVYNQPFWKSSSIVAAVNSVDIPLNKNNLATYIIIHKIQFSGTGFGLPVVNFYDSRHPTLILFKYNNIVANEFIATIDHISKGNSFKMICNESSILFSLQVQIVTQEKIKN